jgi:predicted O-methyltransferase YrrM
MLTLDRRLAMHPEQVHSIVQDLPYMNLEKANLFYNLIRNNNLRNCLELGFMHGVSSAYLAGALDEIDGSLTTIDRVSAQMRTPNIEELLTRLGLRHRVRVFYEPKSFNWRLMDLIEEGRTESFDLCYLDGGHTVYDTGLAFFLVAELIRPGGWLVFDDLYFSFSKSPNLASREWVQKMPVEEQTKEQVNWIFSLLVERNAKFGNFRRAGGWAFAQKVAPLRSEGEEYRLSRDRAICRVLERAQGDPDFREMLLHRPSEALLAHAGFVGNADEQFSFEEVDYSVLPGEDKIDNHYLLPPAKWIRPITRASMEDWARKSAK